MARHAHLSPAPFLLPGGPVGVLLIHGYTGSPPEMRLIAEYLHARGLTVSAPLLPGHGTTPEEMNRCHWQDWTGHARRALVELEERCTVVFVGGLSMGSLITLYLAQERPEIRGAILYSPAVIVANRLIWLTPVMKYLIRERPKSLKSDLTDPEAASRMWSYEVDPVAAAHQLLKLQLHVRRRLRRVTCPTLIFYSPLDTAIHRRSAHFTFDRIGARDKELVTLYRSGHGLTVDSEWETVAERSYQFITQRS